MTHHWYDYFALIPVQRAFFALCVSSFVFPIVGVWILGLNIVPVRFAMMHVALLGIALGMVLGVDPALMGIISCGIVGVALAPLADKPTGLAGPMGLVMTFAIAAALLVLSIAGVNANGAFELLWGSILAMRSQDVWILCGIATTVVLVAIVHRRDLALLLYDREIARSSGVRVGFLTAIVMCVVALAIGAAVRQTGALLVDAITILPALAARNLAQSQRGMIMWAMGIGVIGNLGGFCITLAINQPPGPVLVVTVSIITLLTYLKKM
ncbi:MAG: hypothetical protein RLY87_198 [Chloroflexota bacterium]